MASNLAAAKFAVSVLTAVRRPVSGQGTIRS
jgi:hypothetical protein